MSLIKTDGIDFAAPLVFI